MTHQQLTVIIPNQQRSYCKIQHNYCIGIIIQHTEFKNADRLQGNFYTIRINCQRIEKYLKVITLKQHATKYNQSEIQGTIQIKASFPIF